MHDNWITIDYPIVVIAGMEMSNHAFQSSNRVSETEQTWRPSKFELTKGGWRPSKTGVRASSALTADLMLQKYVSAIGRFARGDLIDLGCGNAPLVGIYGSQVSSYTLADWANSLHDGVSKDLLIDLNQPLPIPDECFDTVVLSDVLEHIERPDQLIAEVKRILRPGGYAIVGVPFLYWLHEQPHDFMRYTKYKLTGFGMASGLSVVTVEETGGGWDVVHDLIMKMLFAHKDGGFAYALYRSYRYLRGTILLKRSIAKWQKRMPLGYLAVYRKPSAVMN